MNIRISAGALAAAIGLSLAAAGGASAEVICNATGDCWHADHHYQYGGGVVVERHPDDWYFHQNWSRDHDRHWRDYHDGRGYYNNGQWVPR